MGADEAGVRACRGLGAVGRTSLLRWATEVLLGPSAMRRRGYRWGHRWKQGGQLEASARVAM